MIVNTHGIILKSAKQGDSSRIISVFTAEFGLVKLIAKGARAAKNKSTVHTEVLSICEVSFYYKKNTELHLLSRSERIINMNKIADSYQHLNIAILMIESLLQSLHIEVPHKELYESTVNFLQVLNDLPTNPFILLLRHQLILCNELGFGIDLMNDGTVSNNFSIASGEWLPLELQISHNSWKFEPDEISLLKYADAIEYIDHSSENLEINSKQKIRLLDFFSRYFAYHLEKKFYYTVY